jgi:hypothetical protein
VGVLYRNEAALRYDDIRKPNESSAPEVVKEVLESEFDKFTIGPPVRSQGPRG